MLLIAHWSSKRQLVMMMANHQDFLFPILKASIATTYGFPRMSQEEYQRKYDEGTLTKQEADNHLTPGPFSYMTYMKSLLEEGFWGDELCLALHLNDVADLHYCVVG